MMDRRGFSADNAKAVRALLFNGSPVKMNIEGISMVPAMLPGQEVLVLPLSFPLRTGRCYAYLLGTGLMVHRLARVKRGECLFVGDNMPYPHHVPISQVVGVIDEKSCRHVRRHGMIVSVVNYIAFRLVRGVSPTLGARIRFLKWLGNRV